MWINLLCLSTGRVNSSFSVLTSCFRDLTARSCLLLYLFLFHMYLPSDLEICCSIWFRQLFSCINNVWDMHWVMHSVCWMSRIGQLRCLHFSRYLAWFNSLLLMQKPIFHKLQGETLALIISVFNVVTFRIYCSSRTSNIVWNKKLTSNHLHKYWIKLSQ